jgi:ribulose-phosphate 3-epimerase
LNNPVIIAPSILAADFANLAREIEAVEHAGADLRPLDVVDGHFVPNLTIGPPVVAALRKITNLPFDVHLMIEEPERFVEEFIRAGANWVSVHAEADAHLNRTLQYIKHQGASAGVAINPATPVGVLEEVMSEADFVLVMSVNPGFGGQEFLPSALRKIRKLREAVTCNKYRARIEVDGGIDNENLADILAAGADTIVAGSSIFRSRNGAAQAVREMKAIAERRAEAPRTT